MRNLKEWRTGELVLGGFVEREIECSRCGERYMFERKGKAWVPLKTHLIKIRFFPESHGYLCLKCYHAAKLCRVRGCKTIAVVTPEGLCRSCYMGEEVKGNLDDLIRKRKTDIFEELPGWSEQYRDRILDEEEILWS